MQEETIVFWLFSFVIAGGVFIIVNAMKYRAKILEMAHRERLAMIERGLKPAGGPLSRTCRPDRPKARSSRMLSGGIVVVGLGWRLRWSSASPRASPRSPSAIGGAIAILGAAFIVTAYVTQREPKRAGAGVALVAPARPVAAGPAFAARRAVARLTPGRRVG